MSGLAVPGLLSIAQTSLDPVGDHDITDRVLAQEFTADRDAATATQSFTYYAEMTYDINSHISFQSSSEEEGTDDAWSMSQIALDTAEDLESRRTALQSGSQGIIPGFGQPVFSLPSVNGVQVAAGMITALDTDGTTAGTFPVTCTMSLDDRGVLSASAFISGTDVLADASPENVLKAQVVQWNVNGAAAPNVTPTTADQLTDTLTSAELTSNYSAELAAINAAYDGVQVIDRTQFLFPAIPFGSSNVISAHVRNIERQSYRASIFQLGDKIVGTTPYTYDVTVQDYLGKTVSLVSGIIYPVLNQGTTPGQYRTYLDFTGNGKVTQAELDAYTEGFRVGDYPRNFAHNQAISNRNYRDSDDLYQAIENMSTPVLYTL